MQCVELLNLASHVSILNPDTIWHDLCMNDASLSPNCPNSRPKHIKSGNLPVFLNQFSWLDHVRSKSLMVKSPFLKRRTFPFSRETSRPPSKHLAAVATAYGIPPGDHGTIAANGCEGAQRGLDLLHIASVAKNRPLLVSGFVKNGWWFEALWKIWNYMGIIWKLYRIILRL